MLVAGATGFRCRAAPGATVVGIQLVWDWVGLFVPRDRLFWTVTQPALMSVLPL